MTSNLGRALACATLAAALVGAAVWLPGASADQPPPHPRDFVSDTFGGATRSIVTGECVRTTLPEAGSVVPGCVELRWRPRKRPRPRLPPPAAPEPKVVATPATSGADARAPTRAGCPGGAQQHAGRVCRRGGGGRGSAGRGQRRLQLRPGDRRHRGSDGARAAGRSRRCTGSSTRATRGGGRSTSAGSASGPARDQPSRRPPRRPSPSRTSCDWRPTRSSTSTARSSRPPAKPSSTG